MFTSGTTSQPKGVVLTQANYAFTGDVMARHCWYAQNLTAAQYDGISGLLGCRPRQLYGRTETGPAVITKRPREIRFVPELPRTSVGKVRKFLLTGGQRRS